MIKFIHKKHIQEHKGDSKFVIYYNVSDIFLGTILLALVVFFIHDYLSHSLGMQNNYYAANPNIGVYPRTNLQRMQN